MRRIAHPVFAMVMILALAVPVFALQDESPRALEVTATITKVDAESVTLQTSDGQTGTFAVDSSTKVSVSGKKASVTDLKPGQTAKFKLKEGKAVSIEVSPS
jgi:hypothetical protein